ncbi:hypothetical protein [Butyrivibrio proteoclasticus]|nr:hypothetical protein [Butyrivibrio proteoclasticus]
MKTLAKNKSIRRLAKKLLWMKKNQPAKYLLISGITDGMIMGIWILISAAVSLWMVRSGLCDFDSAMMAVALIDMYILIFGFSFEE